MSSKIALFLVLAILCAVAVKAQTVSLISSPLTVFAAFNNGSGTFVVPPSLVGTPISSLTFTGQAGPAGLALCCQESNPPRMSVCDASNIWGCYGPKGPNVFEVLLVGPNLDYTDTTTRLFPPPQYTTNYTGVINTVHFVKSYYCPNFEYPPRPPSYSPTNPQQYVNQSTIVVNYNPPIVLAQNYTFIHAEHYNNGTAGTGCWQGDNIGYSKVLSVVATLAISPSSSGAVSASPQSSPAAASGTAAAASPAAASVSQAAASVTSAARSNSPANSPSGAASPSVAASQSVNNSPAAPQCIRCYNNCGALQRRFSDVCTLQLFGTISVVQNAVNPRRHAHRTAGSVERRRVRTKGTRTICCNGVTSSRISSPNFSWNSPVACNYFKREKLTDLCNLFKGNATCFALPTAAANFGKSYYRCLPKTS